MRRRYLMGFLALLCAFSVVSLARQETEKPAPAAPPPLPVRVLSAKQPAIVHAGSFDVEESAPEGKKWLALVVQFNSPKEGTWVPTDKIVVLDASATAYPVIGTDYEGSYDLFEDIQQAGYGHTDKQGNLVWAIVTGEEGVSLGLQQKGPIRIELLFAVPKTARRFSLQVADGTPVSVPLGAAAPAGPAKKK